MGSRTRRADPIRQVSLLRGINVGSAKRIGMAELRAIYESIGCADVTTHIASGNVVLRDARPPDEVSKEAERAIRAALGMDVRVVGRTGAELAAVVAADPWPDADRDHRHVVFLSDVPGRAVVAGLEDAATGGEAALVIGREVHLLLPNGTGRTKLSQALVEKRLGVVATTRNWRTVRRLAELAAG
jgi:uncharacterized protein (DUF1697 family)